MIAPLTRSQLQTVAKTALEAHPLFADGRVPVLINYVPPGGAQHAREDAIKTKGACIEISPVLRQRVVSYQVPSKVTSDCTLSFAIRISPVADLGAPPLLPLNLDTAVDAVIEALLKCGYNPKLPQHGFKPVDEIAQLIEDADGLLSTAVFFTARTELTASA